MTIQEAIKNRHSVRSYQAREIDAATVLTLKEEIEKCNREGDLSIQLITNDSSVFKGLMAHYGGFRGVSNYIALIGPSGHDLEEKLGYYGERIALRAQQLGLNTCCRISSLYACWRLDTETPRASLTNQNQCRSCARWTERCRNGSEKAWKPPSSHQPP